MTAPQRMDARDRLGGGMSAGGLNSKRKKKLIAKLWELQSGICRWCGKSMQRDVPQTQHDRATLDRIVTGPQGGTYKVGNLVLACYECNHGRGAFTAPVFVATAPQAEPVSTA